MTLLRACGALILAALLTACGGEDPPPPAAGQMQVTATEQFERIESPSMQFLPRLEEVEGWELTGDPLVIPAEHLETYLDEDAEHFIDYEVIDMTVGQYRSVAGDGWARVEIFRFPDFVKAFGAFSTRRRGVVETLDIENEAFRGRHSIHIWRGPFYVRLLGGTDRGTEHLLTLARAVAERMPMAEGKPAVFNFLPQASRIPNTERFSADPAFGQPFLANAFQAKFRVDGEVVEGLILPAPDKEAAERVLKEFQNFFVINGRLLDPIVNLGEANFTAEDRFFGRVVAFRIDRFVIVFRGFRSMQPLISLAAETDQRILRTIRERLRAAERERARAAREGRTSGGQ